MECLDWGKIVSVIGLIRKIIGTLLQGIVANRGIPREGEVIKAPNYKCSIWGWGLLCVGFLVSIVGILIS